MVVVLPDVQDVGAANALASVIKERCRCHEVHVATIYACVRVVRVSQREGDAERGGVRGDRDAYHRLGE